MYLFLGILFSSLVMHSFFCTPLPEQRQFLENQVIAHRGAHKKMNLPENSLASLKRAIELGCAASEFDVWMTADGVLVVNHDPEFYGLPIEESSYQDLLQKKHPNGEPIPTVEQYLKEGMKQRQTRLVLELKPSKKSKEHGLKAAQESIALIQRLKAQEWVDYISFDYDLCKRIMKLDPKANVAYLNGDLAPQDLSRDGFFGLDYQLKVIKAHPEWIKVAHELGLTVNVWTVNEPEDMKWLLDEKVEFITTNEPELLFELIAARE